MDLTYATVRIRGAQGDKELELLVDTGSLFSWIPAEILRAIGVEPTGRKRFRTIDAREVVKETGEVVIEVMGERATRIAVFADKGDQPVLGADSLEGLGLELDPTTKQLKKVESFAAFRS